MSEAGKGARGGRLSKPWAFLFAGFGGLFVVAGLVMIAREIEFGRNAVAARGTVVDVRVTENADGKVARPVVEFTIAPGRTIRFEGQASNPHPERGDAVAVLYRPADLEDARIDSLAQRWLLPALFVPIGALAALAALYQVATGPAKPVA